jgi:hypothetical protein
MIHQTIRCWISRVHDYSNGMARRDPNSIIDDWFFCRPQWAGGLALTMRKYYPGCIYQVELCTSSSQKKVGHFTPSHHTTTPSWLHAPSHHSVTILMTLPQPLPFCLLQIASSASHDLCTHPNSPLHLTSWSSPWAPVWPGTTSPTDTSLLLLSFGTVGGNDDRAG